MEQQQNTSAGKGKSVAGFVVSLVAVALWVFITGVAVLQGLASPSGGWLTAGIWTAISALGLILSMAGMKEAGMGGGKKGLGTAGMVLGVVAVLLCAWTFMKVNEAHSASTIIGDAFDQLKTGMQGALDSLKQMTDSLSH